MTGQLYLLHPTSTHFVCKNRKMPDSSLVSVTVKMLEEMMTYFSPYRPGRVRSFSTIHTFSASFYIGNISTSFITDSQQHFSVAASILSSSSKLCNCTVEHQHGGDDIYLHAKIRIFSDQIPPICPSNHPQIWFNLLKQLLKLPFYIDNSRPRTPARHERMLFWKMHLCRQKIWNIILFASFRFVSTFSHKFPCRWGGIPRNQPCWYVLSQLLTVFKC